MSKAIELKMAFHDAYKASCDSPKGGDDPKASFHNTVVGFNANDAIITHSCCVYRRLCVIKRKRKEMCLWKRYIT